MNPVITQQVALNNALVALAKRLKIERCNARIEFSKPQREETYQVTLDALKLSLCYPAFLITAEICPRLPNQEFDDLPSKDDLVLVIKELGYSGKCEMLSAIHTDQMHHPWRTFAAIINRCISGKTTGLDRLKESRAQILWGTLKFFSKTEDCQKYGALIPDGMINQNVKDSKAYKTYYDFATGKVEPKKARKFKKVASPSKKLSPVLEEVPAKKGKRVNRHAKKSATVPISGVIIRDTPGVFVSKKKAHAKDDRGKGIDLLSDVALLEAAQLKKVLKKSKHDTHMVHESGLSEGADFESKFLMSQQASLQTQGNSEDESDDVNDEDDNDDESGNDDDGGNDAHDSERTDSDDDEIPSLTLKDDEEEEYEEEYVH
ncbi:hypothetical protein Tco_1077950 [Tanacetum coccineum]